MPSGRRRENSSRMDRRGICVAVQITSAEDPRTDMWCGVLVVVVWCGGDGDVAVVVLTPGREFVKDPKMMKVFLCVI